MVDAASLVDGDSQSCDRPCGNDLVVFILDNGHTSFLWYYLYGAYPRTVKNWVDDSGMEQLE